MEGDSSTVINWIHNRLEHYDAHPFFHDIWSFLRHPMMASAHHVYWKANSAADKLPSLLLSILPIGLGNQDDSISMPLQGFRSLDLLGCPRTKVV